LIFAVGHLKEEVKEFYESTVNGDLPEAADALIDMIYVALGRLHEMGVPASPIFDEVHRRNMEKMRGRKEREIEDDADAVKPGDWTPPDHSWLDNLSPVLVEACRLRASKTGDYEAGSLTGEKEIDKEEYFPFGLISHAQMVWTKALRIRSLAAAIVRAEILDEEHGANHEPIRETFVDAINYCTYAVESIDGKEN